MGRRALRKIPPELDWTPYLRTVDELPSPWDFAELFARPDAPLEVELGSGKGLFMERASGERPEHNFLGLEVSAKYARFCAARLARAGRDNAQMVHGDGLRVFRELLPSDSVRAIHVYFPDPWWKKRHRPRRVMRPEFLRDVQRTLEPGGRLHFWTDVEEYFQSTLELLKETPLDGPHDVPQREPEHDLDFRTHFERRTRLHEQPVYRAEFVKAGAE